MSEDQSKYGICRFCGKEGKRRESHIIPKFIEKFHKHLSDKSRFSQISANGLICYKQSISKPYFYCQDCENLFNKYETWFADHIFNPYLNKNQTLFKPNEFPNDLYQFAAIMILRNLQFNLEYNSKGVDSAKIAKIEKAVAFWKSVIVPRGKASKTTKEKFGAYIFLMPLFDKDRDELRDSKPKTTEDFWLTSSNPALYERGTILIGSSKMYGFLILGAVEPPFPIELECIRVKPQQTQGYLEATRYDIPLIKKIVMSDIKTIEKYIEAQNTTRQCRRKKTL